MSLELEELKKLHDKAYTYNETTRERASDDLVFYWITQWDDTTLSESQLAYRGEFNILRKAGRQIMSDLKENPVQVDFEPIDETRDDAGETIDGMYRSDDNHNTSMEAYETGSQESIVCGYGAWEIYTKYASNRSGNDNQVIRRSPIPEANNTVFWDPNAILIDKSDATYVSVLIGYSEDGYKDLVKELTGEEIDTIEEGTFKSPEHSYVFPWIGGSGKRIWVTKFYHREKITDKILTFEDPFGQTTQLRESGLDDVMDDMIDTGYEIVSEKEVERYQVTMYIASGAQILNGEENEDGEREGEVIAGEHIPIIPVFGECAYVEGEHHYEGVTKLAKDPQRLRNFQLSYLADIVSTSPRPKPIFWQEQIATHEYMYEQPGADNNFPYYLMNMKTALGEDIPLGPIGVMPEQKMPDALIASIAMSRQAVEDVANPGIPQDIADPDLSGKAVLALQARLDMQSFVYQDHLKHAKRRDAQVYASIAAEVYDVPRKVNLTMADGTRKEVELMQQIIDEETKQIVTINDISTSEFEVFSKIGPSYNSQKEQTIDRIKEMMSEMIPGDPMKNILMLKSFMIMDGVEFDDIRDHARKQLVLLGIIKPDTPEEEQLLAEKQQQGEEESAEMVLARGELLKGQAAMMKEQREGIKDQNAAQNEQAKRQIDVFGAQTDRMDTQIDAQEAGAKINETNIKAFGEQLDNQAKVIQLRSPENMTDDELFREIANG